MWWQSVICRVADGFRLLFSVVFCLHAEGSVGWTKWKVYLGDSIRTAEIDSTNS